MSTRGAIVKLTSKENEPVKFSGVYHHWDSYPEGLGATLFNLYNGFFKKDIKEMLKTLIKDHPAGWSTINNADFSLPIGYKENHDYLSDKPRNPECYCHGDRKEKATKVTQKNASNMGCEYVYAFTKDGTRMIVFSSYHNDGTKMIGAFGMGDPDAKWFSIAEVNLNEDEPDWEIMGRDEDAIKEILKERKKK